MDELGRYNKERWEELAQVGIMYSRPWLDLDAASAHARLDPEGCMGEVADKDVLCLAGGGGQQSAAFSLLGARVTVVDFSETQLDRDRETAEHYGLQAATVQGDMRDLSCFADDSFDLVYHAHSLNFVPDPRQVFDEVQRVLRPGGMYRVSCHNPFTHGTCKEDMCEGNGYPLRLPYVQGAEVTYQEPWWDVVTEDGTVAQVVGPREFRHTLGTMVNGLIRRDFVIVGIWDDTEDTSGDADAEPGTWAHYTAIAPPYLTFWARYRPDRGN